MVWFNLKSAFICCFLFATQQVKSQEVVIKIEEDYTKPKGMMWVKGDEFQQRYIENGLYISKAGKLYPRLDFDYNINQLACKYSSDMEFTIVKMKGDKESFITVLLFFMGLQFQYNELGDWQLGKGNDFTVLKSGKAAVKAGTNVLKIVHRRDIIEFYLNGEKAVEQEYNDMIKIKWYDVKIFAKNKKLQIALDKAIFTGYLDEKNDKLGLYELERFSSISFLEVYGRSDVFIVNENGKQKLMDDRGRMTKEAFDKIDYTYSGNWFIVSNESKTQKGYVDSKGNEMLPMKYKELATSLCNENHKDCFALGSYKIVDNTGGVFYINPETKELISEADAKNKTKSVTTIKEEKNANPQTSISTAKTPKDAEVNPFEVVKYVRSGSAKDLLAYAQKFGANYTSTTKDGLIEYKVTGELETGPEIIIDSKKDGLVVTFKFKDNPHRRIYMEKLKEEGFEGIQLSTASTLVRNDGVDIWFILGQLGKQTWIISKAAQ